MNPAPLALEYQPFAVFSGAQTLQAAYDDLAAELKKYLDPEDMEKMLRCAVYGAAAHEGQKRQSGEPYFIHPIAVCRILARQRFDLPVLQAGLLHDVLEDTIVKKTDMAAEFGEEVTRLVDGVSKLDRLKKTAPQAAVADSFRKMFLATSDDPRVLIIKLADRLHNMQTLGVMRRDKQYRIAKETMEVYAPIASRLGLYYFSIQLQDLAFSYLYPWRHAVLRKRYLEHFARNETLDRVKGALQPRLQALGVKASINKRQRHLWGVYERMGRKQSFREAIRTVPIRIITDNEDNCYRILGSLHGLYRPVHGKFEDYIAAPKSNGYRSLHTSVLMPDGIMLNVQIRTRDMHTLAEAGIISVWHQYAKQRAVQIEAHSIEAEKNMREWLSRLKEIQNLTDDPLQFYDTIKKELVSNEISVYTPKGDVIDLPRHATPVDFAYHIHSDIGNTIAIAKVNGKVVPLDYQLHNGESISIVRDKNNKPKPIWLSFVATSKAREYIRQYINREEREFFITKGRDILNAYLEKNYGKGLDKELSILKNVDGAVLDTKQKEDILVQIGNLSRKPSSVLKVISDQIISEVLGEKISETPEKKEKTEKKPANFSENSTEILIGKEKNIPHKIAQCCHPTPETKKIIGAIGQGTVTIHALDCPNVEKIDLDRRIPAQWANQPLEKDKITIVMEVIFKDKRGILMRLTEHFYNFDINVLDFKIEPMGGGLVKDIFTLETENDDYYIFERLEQRLKFDIPEITEMNLLSLK